MNRVLIIISAFLVAAHAFIAYKDIIVTNAEIEGLVNDFVKNSHDPLMERMQNLIIFQNETISVNTDNFDITTQILEFEVWPGDAESKFISFNRTDEDEVMVRLDRSSTNVKIQGQINITGTVNGEPADQTGSITVTWDLVERRNLWRVNYTDCEVSLTELVNEIDFGTLTTTVEGVLFECSEETPQPGKRYEEFMRDALIDILSE